MALRYDFLNMMRARVGAEGAAPEELQALFGRLEIARRALKLRKDAGAIGFFDVPRRRPALEAMRSVLRGFDKDVDTLVTVGIGGSLLGAQAVHAALDGLEPASRGPRRLKAVFAGDAVDPQAIGDLIASLDWKRTALNVVSKSGDTVEPMAVFAVLRERLVKAVGRERAQERIVATTGERGTLRAIAEREGYATLPVPSDVGGRFSVFTPVGTFPLLAAGINVEELWKGAAAEDAAFWKTSPSKNVPMLYAGLQWLAYRRGRSVSVLMPYAARLRLVGQWYRQLWAESLGKRSDRHRNRVHVGPTPVAAAGPADQHSQIQLYVEGPADKTVTFIEVDDFGPDLRVPEPWPDIEGASHVAGHSLRDLVHAERQATAEGLVDHRRPNGTLALSDLSGRSVGALLQALMTATAVAGELWDVDAFDQPGVEAGKRHLHRLLSRDGS